MKIQEYTVVTAKELKNFLEAVNNKLAEGYQFHGNLVVSMTQAGSSINTLYSREFVKYEQVEAPKEMLTEEVKPSVDVDTLMSNTKAAVAEEAPNEEMLPSDVADQADVPAETPITPAEAPAPKTGKKGGK